MRPEQKLVETIVNEIRDFYLNLETDTGQLTSLDTQTAFNLAANTLEALQLSDDPAAKIPLAVQAFREIADT